MQKPLISIVTPVYNNSSCVSETIKSVLSQTYDNFELIIVDDCSKDNSRDIIKSFSDKRIVFFANEENKGAAYCRNLAIKNAHGEYIAFLDGDDLWEPTKLEEQIKFMIENSYSFSYTCYDQIDVNGSKLGCLVSGPKKVTHKMLVKSDYLGCLTVMYKKDIYPNLSIPDDIRKRNDYALWLLISKKTDCYLLDKCLSHYRVGGTGLSKTKKSKLIKYHAIMFNKTLGYNKLWSWFCAYRNAFYYFVRKNKYRKKAD